MFGNSSNSYINIDAISLISPFGVHETIIYYEDHGHLIVNMPIEEVIKLIEALKKRIKP
jgi:galactose-1-phosphate uridylyltransferase